MLLRQDAVEGSAKLFKDVAGVSNVVFSAEFEREGRFDIAAAGSAPGVIFSRLGVAVVSGDPHQINALTAEAAGDSPILAVEPERIMHAVADGLGPVPPATGGGVSLEYLRGFRDAVVDLYDRLTSRAGGAAEAFEAAASFTDDASSTWGLKATGVLDSRFSGKGIRVAILDTGLDLEHPDFAGRAITAQSFIDDQEVQDGYGHGTHCTGTACGPQRPGLGRRYGIAFRAEIFTGKVLSNAGSGPDTGILAGIEWALANECHIISMSLEAKVQPGETFSSVYEHVGRRCLDAGTLIVAAAGNDSEDPFGRRQEPPAPVGRPANCPSILAVAAVDRNLQIAPFSNGGINPDGGGVDIAGPGVDIYSSWPMPTRNRTISGTSMATPHVAGIAALWSEARGARGAALWQALTGAARRLALSSRDAGAGLVQAP